MNEYQLLRSLYAYRRRLDFGFRLYRHQLIWVNETIAKLEAQRLSKRDREVRAKRVQRITGAGVTRKLFRAMQTKPIRRIMREAEMKLH